VNIPGASAEARRSLAGASPEPPEEPRRRVIFSIKYNFSKNLKNILKIQKKFKFNVLIILFPVKVVKIIIFIFFRFLIFNVYIL
jgi:hypothetical protein